MWFGTSANGIFIVNAKGDSITSFSVKEGLSDNTVISLNKYNGHIYAGTKNGLSIITPSFSTSAKWRVESFGKEEGFSKIVYSQNSDVITQNGKFLWGDKGVTVFNYSQKIKSVLKRILPALIFLTSRSISDLIHGIFLIQKIHYGAISKILFTCRDKKVCALKEDKVKFFIKKSHLFQPVYSCFPHTILTPL